MRIPPPPQVFWPESFSPISAELPELASEAGLEDSLVETVHLPLQKKPERCGGVGILWGEGRLGGRKDVGGSSFRGRPRAIWGEKPCLRVQTNNGHVGGQTRYQFCGFSDSAHEPVANLDTRGWLSRGPFQWGDDAVCVFLFFGSLGQLACP